MKFRDMPLVRGLRTVLFMLSVFVLAGCGNMTRLAYNNGDIALRMMAGDYFNFDDEQSAEFRLALASFHTWHRRTELPQYAELFGAAGERMERGLSPADIHWAIRNVRARYAVLAAQAVEDSAPLLARLTPENFTALDEKFAESNAKLFKETMTGDEKKRTERRVKAIRKRFEEWLGDLSPEQEARLVAYVRTSPQYSAERFAERRERQQQFIELVREHQGAAPQLSAALRSFFVDYERNRGEAYERHSKEWEDGLVQLIADMARAMSAEQREHATSRFQKLASDFRALAGLAARERSAASDEPLTTGARSLKPGV